MKPLAAKSDIYPKDYSACSGCSLCLLVCPVFREKRDLCHSSQGRARAYRHDSAPGSIGDSLFSCALCGSCNTICPEGIDLSHSLAEMRRAYFREAKDSPVVNRLREIISGKKGVVAEVPKGMTVLLPGRGLGEEKERVERVVRLLGGDKKVFPLADDGWEIGLAYELGIDLPVGRLERFVDSLRDVKRIIVSDGIMKRVLRNHLPKARVTGIGEELTSIDSIVNVLRPGDLYVIESRSYNTDIKSLTGHYNRIRRKVGCSFNLDLHNTAIPTTATGMHRIMDIPGIDACEQARWIMKGRDVNRIVVESMEDAAVFSEVTDIPVVHLADIV